MPSLAEQRQAIADGMRQSRTGQDMVTSLNRLTTRPRERKSLRPLDPQGLLAARRGTAPWVEGRPNSSGTGVAWPLTEADFSLREYHPDGQLSSDGLFMIPAIKKIVLTDADGKLGTVYLAEPT